MYLHMSSILSVGLSIHLSTYIPPAVDASVYCVFLFFPFHVQRKDLLQQMLDATQVSGSQLEEGHVLIHSMGVLLAGHETTSNALSFISYLLALNPEVQEKLAEEVVNYLQENPVSSKSVHVVSHEICLLQLLHRSSLSVPPNLKDKTLYEAAQELEYLDNVVQESLRMYSPGTMYINALRDLSLPSFHTHPQPIPSHGLIQDAFSNTVDRANTFVPPLSSH